MHPWYRGFQVRHTRPLASSADIAARARSRRRRRTSTNARESSLASTTTRSRSRSSRSACGPSRTRRRLRRGSSGRRRRLRWSRSVFCSLARWLLTAMQDYKEYHTDTTVHFIVTLTEKGKEAIKKDGLEKAFKVTSSLATSNMVCFDPEGKIKKYATPEEILLDFYDIRMDFYHKRKVSSSLFTDVAADPATGVPRRRAYSRARQALEPGPLHLDDHFQGAHHRKQEARARRG